MDQVILVDQHDKPVGAMEKMEAHETGMLHRAFSVLLFNSKGEVLLQKRSRRKYHSGGLWTNTCCSHPQPGEDIVAASKRRLKQEMGIDADVSFAYKFIYKTKLDGNLIEHELDHVLTGMFEGEPVINEAEVEDWKFASVDEIRRDVERNPDQYTYWFKLIINDPKLRLHGN